MIANKEDAWLIRYLEPFLTVDRFDKFLLTDMLRLMVFQWQVHCRRKFTSLYFCWISFCYLRFCSMRRDLRLLCRPVVTKNLTTHIINDNSEILIYSDSQCNQSNTRKVLRQTRHSVDCGKTLMNEGGDSPWSIFINFSIYNACF